MLRDVPVPLIVLFAAAPWIAQVAINRFIEATQFLRAVWRMPTRAMAVCTAVGVAVAYALARDAGEFILFAAAFTATTVVTSVAHSLWMLRQTFGNAAYRWARKEFRAGRAVTLQAMKNF